MATIKGINTVEQLKAWLPGAVIQEAAAAQVSTAKKARKTRKKPRMVVATVAMEGDTLVAFIPAITRSEANESKWTRKMVRKLSAKKAVKDTLGCHYRLLVPFAEAYHAGKPIRVTLTRLGGRKLDACNLPSSMKAIEDALEGALLADDGSPLWIVEYRQNVGHHVGVQINLST
jgi:hypothetical protein